MGLIVPFFIHANVGIGIKKGRPVWKQFFGWVVSPMHHHWHHSPENHFPYGQNFGVYTLIWDRLFGTLHAPGTWPEKYGLTNQDKYVRGVFRRFWGPFLPTYDLMGNKLNRQ